MSDVFFLSGWAGPGSLFPGLSGRVRFAAPFLDGDEASMLARLETSPARVLVGWSTGAHMVLKHAVRLFPRFPSIVLAAPFLRFADSLPVRITAAMAGGMKKNPEVVTREFWNNAGVPGTPDWQPQWAAPLLSGLDYLLTSAAPATPVTASHVTVLHGQDDRIVRAKAITRVMDVLQGARLVAMPGGHYPDPTVLAAQLSV